MANSQLTGSSQEARRSDTTKSDTHHPRTTYRESNASRLRQENRGMAARGVVKELRSRSKSAASRSSSLASTQSRTSHRSDSPSPAKRAAVVVAASSRRSSSGSPSRTEDMAKKEPSSIKAPVNKGVIDSRSKTLNLAPKLSSQQTSDVEASVSSNTSSDRTPSPKRRTPVSRRAPPPPFDSDRLRLNASPLKHQKNSKDSPSCIQEILNSYNETIPEPKDQYPFYNDRCMGSSYSAKNELPTPTATRNVAISLLAHLIMWRFIHILKIIWLSNFTIPNVLLAIGIFFWTETKKNNSTADHTLKQSSYGNDVGRPVIKIPPMKTLRSPMPPTRDGRFVASNPKETTYGSTKTVNSVMQKNGQRWGTDYENANRNCGKVSKQPKLDDIMSSCLLVTKKGAKNRMDVKLAISKPAPIDEKARKQLLIEAKTKFRTKKFWNDSKYEKIEGLNWISWG